MMNTKSGDIFTRYSVYISARYLHVIYTSYTLFTRYLYTS